MKFERVCGSQLEPFLYALEYENIGIVVPQYKFGTFVHRKYGSRIYECCPKMLEAIEKIPRYNAEDNILFIIEGEESIFCKKRWYVVFEKKVEGREIIPTFLIKKLIFEREDTRYDIRKLILRLLDLPEEEFLGFEAFDIYDYDDEEGDEEDEEE